jgi:hypothetical protein
MHEHSLTLLTSTLKMETALTSLKHRESLKSSKLGHDMVAALPGPLSHSGTGGTVEGTEHGEE